MSVSFNSLVLKVGSISIKDIIILTNYPPVWSTPAGSLGSPDEGSNVNILVQATDPDNDTLTYTVQSGTLPPGLSLSSSGSITGTPSAVTTNTTSNFTIRATDPSGLFVDRAFSLTISNINQAPVWTTSAGSLGSYNELTSIGIDIVATDPDSGTVTYSLHSGSLPSGVSLSSAGHISGTAASLTSDTTSNFTIRATEPEGLYTDRAFSITINNVNHTPIWDTSSGSLGAFDENTYIGEIQLEAHDPDNDTLTFSLFGGTTLPTGLDLSTDGIITGIATDDISSDTTTNFTVSITDTHGAHAEQNFSITINSVTSGPQWVTPPGNIYSGYQDDSIDFQFNAVE